MELKVEIPEDVLFPPLPELSYVCSGRITDSKCSGPSIFRDQDFITATASDLIASMSISGLIRTRLRGERGKDGSTTWQNMELKLNPGSSLQS